MGKGEDIGKGEENNRVAALQKGPPKGLVLVNLYSSVDLGGCGPDVGFIGSAMYGFLGHVELLDIK